MTPSNANTSGLEVVAFLLVNRHGQTKASTMPPSDGGDVAAYEPLVTAASAQARIAELEALVESYRRTADLEARDCDAAEARADRLARFGQHINWELSFCYLDDQEGEPGCWAVHSVNGGRNDREWTLIGRGDTPDDAIRAALQQETQP